MVLVPQEVLVSRVVLPPQVVMVPQAVDVETGGIANLSHVKHYHHRSAIFFLQFFILLKPYYMKLDELKQCCTCFVRF